MSFVATIDFLSLVASLAATAILLRGWRQDVGAEVRVGLAALLGLTSVNQVLNLCLWWRGSTALAPYEDYTQLLIPGAWCFFIYLYGQDLSTRKLRESERQLRQLSENIREVFWLAAWPQYSVLFVSQAYETIWGRPVGDLYKNPRNWLEAIHPDDRARIEAAFQAQGESGGINEEYRIVRPDGSMRWIHDRGFPIRDARDKVYRIAGIAEDITDRRLAADAMARFATILDATTDFVGMADANARPLYLNRAGRKLLGLKADEDISLAKIVDFHPAWAQDLVMKEGIGAAIRDGAWSGETALLTPDGREVPVSQVILAHKDRLGRVEFLSTMMRDLSEGRQAEETMVNVAKGVSAATGEAFFRKLVEKLAETLEADNALIVEILEGDPGRAHLVAGHPPEALPLDFIYDLAGTPCESVVTHQFCAYTDEVQEQFPRDHLLASLRAQGYIGASLCDSSGKTLGIMMVLYRRSIRNLTRVESLLKILAARAAAELERKEAEGKLRGYSEQLRTLSIKLMEAQEAERRRIARELHDQIGQDLTAFLIHLHGWKQKSDQPVPPAQLEDTIRLAEGILQRARDLSLELRPSMLDDLGLVAALRWYLDGQAQRAGFQPRFSTESIDQRLPPELETVCFRVAQEAVTNIVRHARAREVHVEISRRGGRLELAIGDDGAGFDVPAAQERARHGQSLGLPGMEERVSLLGGRFEIDSAPGRGCRVRASFPLPLSTSGEAPARTS
jgi:PAS domain S-box-containing protein